MKSKLVTITIISTFLISGCGNSSNKTSYDELDLIKYQACIDYYMAGIGKSSATYLLSEQFAQQAEDQCKSLRPIKK